MGAVVECGCLAFVDGRGLREDDWELQPRSFVAIHVQVSGRSPRNGDGGGLVLGAPLGPRILLKGYPDVLNLPSLLVRVDLFHEPACAVDEAILNIDVVAKHDSDADGDAKQSL